MPRINLLPLKAARRADLMRTELLVFAGLVGAVACGLLFWHHSGELEVDDMRARILEEQRDIGDIEKTVALVEDFKKKAQVLERKLSAIDTLKRQKMGPAKMLSDLADILTNQRRVWLTSLEEHDGLLTLHGGAMDQDNIAEFQLALEQGSKFFQRVNLSLVSSTGDAGATYFQWAISCRTNYAAG